VFTGATKPFVIACERALEDPGRIVDGGRSARSRATRSRMLPRRTRSRELHARTSLAVTGGSLTAVPLSTEAHESGRAGRGLDGAGGEIIAWDDRRPRRRHIRHLRQRVNASGVPLWARDGVALYTASGIQASPAHSVPMVRGRDRHVER